MPRLPRVTQKIFANSAPANQVTTFGSIKAGSPVYTKDISQIMNANYDAGWSDAVEDDYAPYRQDRNALDITTTQQIAYLLCEGIAEYDSNTTYYFGQITKVIESTLVKIYMSIADNNTSAVTDTTKWVLFMTIQNTGTLLNVNLSGGTHNNPIFTGTVTVPTVANTDDSQNAASTAFVHSCLTGSVSTITTGELTANRALISNSSKKVAVSSTTSTELGYVHGVTSAIQTQLDAKFNSANIQVVASLPASPDANTFYFVTG